MRENRQSGSEGGEPQTIAAFLPLSVAFHAPTTPAATIEFADRKAPRKYRDAAENMQLSKNLFTLVQSRARAMPSGLGDGPASLYLNWLNEVSQQPIA